MDLIFCWKWNYCFWVRKWRSKVKKSHLLFKMAIINSVWQKWTIFRLSSTKEWLEFEQCNYSTILLTPWLCTVSLIYVLITSALPSVLYWCSANLINDVQSHQLPNIPCRRESKQSKNGFWRSCLHCWTLNAQTVLNFGLKGPFELLSANKILGLKGCFCCFNRSSAFDFFWKRLFKITAYEKVITEVFSHSNIHRQTPLKHNQKLWTNKPLSTC